MHSGAPGHHELCWNLCLQAQPHTLQHLRLPNSLAWTASRGDCTCSWGTRRIWSALRQRSAAGACSTPCHGCRTWDSRPPPAQRETARCCTRGMHMQCTSHCMSALREALGQACYSTLRQLATMPATNSHRSPGPALLLHKLLLFADWLHQGLQVEAPLVVLGVRTQGGSSCQVLGSYDEGLMQHTLHQGGTPACWSGSLC